MIGRYANEVITIEQLLLLIFTQRVYDDDDAYDDAADDKNSSSTNNRSQYNDDSTRHYQEAYSLGKEALSFAYSDFSNAKSTAIFEVS